MRLKPIPRFILIAMVVFGGGYFAITQTKLGVMIQAPAKPAQVAPKAVLPEIPVLPPAKVPPKAVLPNVATNVAPMPVAAQTSRNEVRLLSIPWNATAGLLLANEGASTTPKSLMGQRGINLKITRQDMYDQMQNELITFASDLCSTSSPNPNPTRGAHFVIIMGDGAPAFMTGLNQQLARLGPGCTAEIVGSVGFSRGEDALWGPEAWLGNPQAMRGSLIAGVVRDGDWDIALKLAADNDICNNANEKVYDPDCLNWVPTDSFVDAGQKYITGFCENYPVVHGGKQTGETVRKCVDGVVTWTPGDVDIAMNRGGLVPIVSTREYFWQMPAVIIGIQKWNDANRSTMVNMLAAAFDGADLIKSSDDQLKRAAAYSVKVWNEQDANYWYRYFKGVSEPDKGGKPVKLGGSSVSNLADNEQLFGMNGKQNIYDSVYTAFGNIQSSQYPELMPSFYPTEQILNLSYLKEVASRSTATTEPEMPVFQPVSVPIKEKDKIAKKNWSIQFDFAKSSLAPSSQVTLQELLRQLSIAGQLAIEIHGHTDGIGNHAANKKLSESRAFAVKQWLEQNGGSDNFPQGRIRVFAHGDTIPLATNDTEAGRAQNRRVEIVLGTVS